MEDDAAERVPLGSMGREGDDGHAPLGGRGARGSGSSKGKGKGKEREREVYEDDAERGHGQEVFALGDEEDDETGRR